MVWERIKRRNSDIDEEDRVSGTIIPEREREKRNKVGWVTTNSELLPPHFAALHKCLQFTSCFLSYKIYEFFFYITYKFIIIK
jgi:hypothetical protein